MKMPSSLRPASLLPMICLGAALWAAAPLAAFSAERGPLRSTSAAAKAAAATETEARVIVTFKADATKRALSAGASGAATATAAPRHAQALSQRLGLAMTDGRALGERTQVVKASGITSKELVARLAAQSDVESVVVDQRRRAFSVPNDSLYLSSPSISPVVGQWYLRAPDSTAVAAINAEPAWDITTGSSSVVVAVLDTGVRFDHPDLTTKLLPGYDFVNTAANANDGGGRDSDASDPGDYVTSADVGLNGCTSDDVGSSSWHGTHTAGLVGAATNNALGMASVGYNVMVQPLRVLGKCGGFDSDIQAAMLYAGGIAVSGVPTNPTPAKVINLSLGGSGACGTYQNVVNQLLAKNIVIVVAAGNDGLAVGSPGNCAGVIAVGGLRHAGTKVGYSDLGSAVTLSAPAGNCVNTGSGEACLYPLLTTGNSGTTTPVAGAAGATYTTSGADASLGTSFAAPLVSGTVALMFSANPSLTPAAIKTALTSTARAFPTTSTDSTVGVCTAPTSTAQSSECICTTSTCGAGMLDTGRAVAAAVALIVPTATINVTSGTAVAGTAVTLDGSASSAGSSLRPITAYQWAIVSGAATFTSATNAASATVLPSTAGSVVVSLTVTDSAGTQTTANTTLTVSAVPVTPPPPVVTPPVSSGGGGGGASSVVWLLMLLSAIAAVWRVTPVPRRIRADRADRDDR